ncbi:MAG: VWA domain-containing protein [Nitriliruptorales bacterium]|nr:VWA domain-containing protein [Nitriliruptorales bacterium]
MAADDQEQERRPADLSVEDVSVDRDAVVKVKVVAPGDLPDGAPAEAFTVTEDGQQRDVKVKRIPTDDLQIVLALDTSGSVAAKPLRVVKSAALSFVNSLPPHVPVAVVEFNSQASVVTNMTHRREPVRRAIKALDARGRTSLLDGVLESIAAFDKKADKRRVIVLMADGEDNQSVSSFAKARAALRKHDVVLHAVRLATDYSDVKPLRALAQTGNGKVIAMDDADRVHDAYRQTGAKLINLYELTYRSQADGNATLKVRFEHRGVMAQGTRQVDVPSAPPAAGGLMSLLGSGFWTRRWALHSIAALWVLAVVIFVASARRLSPR